MNTLKTIGLALLFTFFMNACTDDNTIEEHLISKKTNTVGTGSDGINSIEEDKG